LKDFDNWKEFKNNENWLSENAKKLLK